jgi:hypothetical protein
MRNWYFRVIVLVTGFGLLPACDQKQNLHGAKPTPAPLVRVVVSMREDGLMYRPFEKEPFTGETIAVFPNEPWKMKRKEGYTMGKRDGDTLEFFTNGKTKAVQRYRMGKPEYAAIYHPSGRLKMEVQTAMAGGAAGLYQRWYADGSREAVAGLDENQHWHGDFKEWTLTGELKTHYLFEHGVLRQITLEDPGAQARREKGGLALTRVEKEGSAGAKEVQTIPGTRTKQSAPSGGKTSGQSPPGTAVSAGQANLPS